MGEPGRDLHRGPPVVRSEVAGSREERSVGSKKKRRGEKSWVHKFPSSSAVAGPSSSCLESLCLWRPVQPTPSNSCPPCLPPPSAPPRGTAAAAAPDELRSRPAPGKGVLRPAPADEAASAPAVAARKRVGSPLRLEPADRKRRGGPCGQRRLFRSWYPGGGGGPPEPIGRNHRSQTPRGAARPLWLAEDGKEGRRPG